jgi:hypothetical protein
MRCGHSRGTCRTNRRRFDGEESLRSDRIGIRRPRRTLADQSLTNRCGEFRLVDLGGGRTRLEGRTWYTFDMHPQAYWTLWSDLAIHKIHRRVLAHVKQLAESD